MAEDSDLEKTESPSSRRLEQAREPLAIALVELDHADAVEVDRASRIGRPGAHGADDGVAAAEEEIGEVHAVLAGHAGDEGGPAAGGSRHDGESLTAALVSDRENAYRDADIRLGALRPGGLVSNHGHDPADEATRSRPLPRALRAVSHVVIG